MINHMSVRQAVRARVLMNRASGAALGGEASSLLQQITDACKAAGWRVEAECIEPDDLERTISECASEPDYDVLVIAGGDGTIRTAAEVLIGTDIPLGIIPLGTFNQVARQLGIPTDIQAAVRCLTKASPERIDCARVNGRVFLASVLMGLPPRVTRGRQQLRGRSFRERVHGYFALLRRASAATRKIGMRIDAEGETRQVRALSVVISNNPYNDDGLFMAPSGLSSGRLGIYVSKHQTGAAMFAAFARALLGFWTSDEEFERFTAQNLMIDTRHKRLLVSLDGEIEFLETPLHFEILPQALCVLKT